jgi:hypothetical protein
MEINLKVKCSFRNRGSVRVSVEDESKCVQVYATYNRLGTIIGGIAHSFIKRARQKTMELQPAAHNIAMPVKHKMQSCTSTQSVPVLKSKCCNADVAWDTTNECYSCTECGTPSA